MRGNHVHRVRGLAIIVACGIAGISSCFSQPVRAAEAAPARNQPRQHTLLDADWLFHLGDISPNDQVIGDNYADAQWRHVQVPNDYVQYGTYSQTEDRGHGYLPVDVGWYRKHFSIPESDHGKILRLDFDGVFRDSTVWLNGHLLGTHQSGYTPFSYDITKIAKIGGENILAVRVDPRKFEGWWYEGGGIYRHVHLTAMSPLHVAQYGTYVVSKVPNGDQGGDAVAELAIQTILQNGDHAAADGELVSEILSPDGKLVQTVKTTASVPGDGSRDVWQHTSINHPKLWSLESPELYQLRTTVLKNGKPVDSTTTTFGIRTIHFDANRGFFLNGKHVEIQGTANHQDFGGLGIAVPDSIETWRVEQLKKFGCNGWRTAHNPPNTELLDACDRLGMLVMDENRHLGDTYFRKTKSGDPYSDLSDLATMIQRDRNHPSIIMWSMCNEEGLSRKPEGAKIFSAMMKIVHRYDQTRPITCAINGGVGAFNKRGIAGVEDIIGVNYNAQAFDGIHKLEPDKPMFGSEDTNQKTTRGEYANDRATGMCSAYNLSNKLWLAAVTRPFMAGTYTWTGFDYKGEPNPYGWPDVSNNTGLLDSCGFPKDKAFYFQSCWSNKPMVHLLPATWNMPGKEGQNIRVIAFSNARQVELFLNGRSLGTKDMPHDDLVEWQVPYQPGKLIAKGYTDGRTVATDEQDTTGKPARIVLSPDRTTLHATGEDAVVIPVSILDAEGRVVPDSINRVTFHLTGRGQILGVGNGDPADHDTDKSNQRNVFHGHCIAVIQADSKPEALHLTATSPGLTSASVELNVQ